MTKLDFDARQVKPWLGAEHDTPREHALRLWMSVKNEEGDIRDFDFACEMARFDRDYWDAIQQWAWSQPEPAEWALASLGRVLGRKPPRRGVGATKRRDALLRAIAARLKAQYDLPFTQSTPGGGKECIAAILSGLPSTPSEGTIATEVLCHLGK